MEIVEVVVSALIGYLLGCFQTAYIVGRVVKRIDIRTQGSNNAGASNVTMVLGWKYGAITAFTDVFKAALAVILVGIIFPGSKELIFIAGASAVLGHIFPFFLKFKGGKGAASLIGMLLAIDLKIAIIAILTIVVITLAIDYIALGSIGMFAVLPVSTYAFNYPIVCTLIGVALALLCVYKHQINIKRIMKKEETGLRRVVNKNKS
jgi:acyl phosphate:glycerol-3-phosphate acyltransferase